MQISEKLERRIFIASAASALFVSGVAIGAFAPPITKFAEKMGARFDDIRVNAPAYLGIRPSGHLAPYRREILESISLAPSAAEPGIRLVTGLFGDKLAARIYDEKGALVYEWPNNFFDLFPESKKYKYDALLHGDYLYPNGDLLVVIDSQGLARISACGDVIWRNRSLSHHSVDVDDDGFIWTPRLPKKYDDRRLAQAPVRIDRIIRIDPSNGEIVETIDLASILMDAGLEGIIKANRIRADDVVHLNDVEILKKADAAAFPMFAAGDIMLSGRNTNLILILDGKTRQVKWWRSGPMHGQHDPDFEPNGEITVYDNRTAGVGAPKNGFKGGAEGSRIIALDPASYAYRELYTSDARNTFYSGFRGKHQQLSNGNILITESEGGRAFEATPDGRIAWMAVSKYDEKDVGWLMSATRYPSSYNVFSRTCPQTGATED